MVGSILKGSSSKPPQRDEASSDSDSAGDSYGDGTATPAETEIIGQDDNVDVETDSGKLKQLLGVLRKVIGVKDLANMRLSLPASLLTPVGNLEFWHYLDRPDLFAAIGEQDLDPLTRFIAIVRWMFSKELRYVRQRVCKPYNSALGEQFRCVWEVVPASPHEFIVYHDLYDGPVDASAPPSAKSSPALSATKNSSNLPKNMSNLSLSETLNNNHKRKISKGAASSGSSLTNVPSASTSGSKPLSDESCKVAFVNEQVSHHPPISAFWYESTPGEGRARVTASGIDQIAAKFNGTSVRIAAGSQNKGIFVRVPDVTEDEYQVTHPGAYITGFLGGSPYIVMSDSTYINTIVPETSKSGGEKRYRAIISYPEESWVMKPKFQVEGVIYETDGGASAEYTKIKQVPESAVVARIKGSWRGRITIKKKGEKVESTLLDMSQLEVVPKSVRPLEKQNEMETRKFWEPVTNSIVKKDYKKATVHKQTIEQAQRDKAAKRKENEETFTPVLFDADISSGRGQLTEQGLQALREEIEMSGHEKA